MNRNRGFWFPYVKPKAKPHVETASRSVPYPMGISVDQDLVIYLLLKTDWLCRQSRLRIQSNRKSLARSDRFILESTGRIVQFDSDHRRQSLIEC